MDNYIGKTYGNYKIIGVLDKRAKDGHKVYSGRCLVCDEIIHKPISHFKRKNENSICKHVQKIGNLKVKASLISNTRLRKIFVNMLYRCYDTNHKDYRFYGKCGIKVYDEWISNPKLFENWAINNKYKDNLTIDRIESNKDYCPDNCRWIDSITNSIFKINTNYITATVTLSGKQWARLIPDIGVNKINKMLKADGYKKVVQFIEEKLKDKRKI